MLMHLFTLIWNKKKQHSLVILEMIISFMVLFAVFTLIVYYFTNYRKPMGFRYDNVLSVSISLPPGSTANKDSAAQVMQTLKRTVLALPEVKGMSYVSSNSPFSMNTSNNVINHNNQEVMAMYYTVDDAYPQVLGVKMLEGRWFNATDAHAKEPPVVINETLKENFFPGENAVGKILKMGDEPHRITGVVQTLKDKGDYVASKAGTYKRAGDDAPLWLSRILISYDLNTDAGFEGRLFKTFSSVLKTSSIEIEYLTKKRVSTNSVSLIPMILLLVVGGFLIINVALGIFGVLWYSVNKRRAEIGLRRAVGASGSGISGQIVSETLVLSTFALLIGVFFAIQFPLLNLFNMPSGVYITAIVLSVLFIYILVVICAFYPGRQAAQIYPAVALHED
ncbi:ABC transporter permease [Chitinophaga barathri]|uniref:FtsX-like permease family protein n=1 Tax=Chitinophaga barathri TaxID=1647451 RepID=A0A3N4N5H5_9BACT|nr:ABC transporter permease [Chitinophaga barathri]RPD42873.1 FtsX-like permease family protein [Chitinophaga barathri]